MMKTVFWAAVIVGTLSAGAAFADNNRGGNGHHWGWDNGNNGNNGGNGNNAPLPIAALGLPFAAGLFGYAIRRKKS